MKSRELLEVAHPALETESGLEFKASLGYTDQNKRTVSRVQSEGSGRKKKKIRISLVKES